MLWIFDVRDRFVHQGPYGNPELKNKQKKKQKNVSNFTSKIYQETADKIKRKIFNISATINI